MQDSIPSTFCPLAWTHSFVNQNGAYQVCCTSEEFDNNIRDNEGKVMSVSDGVDPHTVMNTDYMKKIRLQMLNGEWPAICTRCKISENLEGVSRRNVEIRNFESSNEDFITSTQPDGTVPAIIKSADYRLGNLCNLQCRMCNPRSTKLWIKDWNDIKPPREQFSPEVMDSYQKYDWIDSPELLKDFAAKASHLEHIHFAGGEPLLVPQMSLVLQKCIDSGNAANIVVTYNTNLTVLPMKVLKLWKHFKGVKILASIDAIGDLNYYIRYPSKWDQIEKNLRFIEENHKEYNILECMLSTTVQALNVLRLDDIYAYLEQFKFIVRVPNLVNLYMPPYQQTTVLPIALRKIASIQLQQRMHDLSDKVPSHYKYLVENIPQIIHFMNSPNENQKKSFERFIDFQHKFDELKKLKLSDYVPEFNQFV
jgi:sulfatase maturation enzyme AslB (radical SAM superfamily)